MLCFRDALVQCARLILNGPRRPTIVLFVCEASFMAHRPCEWYAGYTGDEIYGGQKNCSNSGGLRAMYIVQ